MQHSHACLPVPQMHHSLNSLQVAAYVSKKKIKFPNYFIMLPMWEILEPKPCPGTVSVLTSHKSPPLLQP